MKRALIAAVLGTFVLAAVVAGRAALQLQPSPAPALACAVAPRVQASGYFIGVVGDSWISGQRLDNGIHTGAARLQPTVFSRGVPGATTKVILGLLPEVLAEAQKWPPERRAVLLTGGINDRFTYSGANHYAAHMHEMVRAANLCGVQPVVLTIPPFERPTDTLGHYASVRRELNRLLSGDSRGTDSTAYTATLRTAIEAELRAGTVSVIDAHGIVSPSEISAKYSDGVHLKEVEREAFGAAVGREIAVAVARRARAAP